jgi:hypothetical protein
VDVGTEKLVQEWKVLMGRLIDTREGIARGPTDPDRDDLFHKAGSASYKRPEKIEGIPVEAVRVLSGILAPIESDGPGDKDEWDLFKAYLPLAFKKAEDLQDPHSLSTMLNHWRADRVGSHCLCYGADNLISVTHSSARSPLSTVLTKKTRMTRMH